MRAVAVIAVIVHHIGKDLLPSGFLGVDVFFVISGYVISASLAGRTASGLTAMLAQFYLRRMKRLLPALAVFVLVTAVLISLFNPAPGQSLTTGMLSLAGLSNLYLLAISADYFGNPVRMNPFTHTWSLGVEEQFYLVYPALAWLLGAGTPGPRGRLLAVLAALCGLSAAAYVVLSADLPGWAYYLMPARFWELAVGALVFWSGLGEGQRAARWQPWVASAALAALLLVMFLPQRLQVGSTVIACALTALVIAFTRARGGAGFSLLSSRPLVAIGLVSYSLYLWHWGVLVIARWTIGVHWWSVPFLLALMFALAALSYRFVELPARRHAWSRTRAMEAGLGLGGGAAIFALVGALANTYEGQLYTGTRPSLAKTGIESLIDSHSVAGTTWSGLPCVLAHNAQLGRRIPVERCTLGDPERAGKRLLVIGNSFAASFTGAFDQMVAQDGYAVTLAASWGASAVPEVPNRTAMKDANDYYWRAVVPELLARLRPGDQVLMLNDMSGFAPAEPSADSRAQLMQLRSGLQRLASELSARGIGLAILHGIPLMREADCGPSMAASQWFSPAGRPCKYLSRPETLRRRAGLDSVLTGLQTQGLVTVIDLFELFCPDRECQFEARDGTLLYRDEHSHPSVEAARMAAPLIRKALVERGEARN